MHLASTWPLAQLAPLTQNREAVRYSTSAHVLRYWLQPQRAREERIPAVGGMPVTTHFLACGGECTGRLAQLAPLHPNRETVRYSTSAHVLRY